MLQKLRIQNYAIIDELTIDFNDKLNIITGETGAGKSILMGALDLVLGKRADTTVLKNVEKKCFVEAYFAVQHNQAVQHFFTENDLDADAEIIIRREIAATGKSRSFVNDTPVNVSQLKELSSHLVDLHRQFDTLEIGSTNFQREVIDALADNADLLTQLKEVFGQYSTLKQQLEKLQLQQAEADKEVDYNTFLLEEFTTIHLKPNELEEVEAALKLLSNAETVKQQLGSIYGAIAAGEEPLSQQLKALAQKLGNLKAYHGDIEGLQQRLQSAQVEVQDIADELERIDDGIHYDAERLNEMNERLSAGYKLLKKHGVTTTSQLLEIQATLEERLSAVLNIGNAIEKLQLQTQALHQKATSIAQKITVNRNKQLPGFIKNVNALLTQIGMPNAQINVVLHETALTATGADEVQFLFDANKSNRFEPLHKVASGGELSRLMLSVKSLVAKKLQLPVLIFDEIDTGISGEAAKQVGIIMKDLSTTHQLIAITHQPQIAAKADAHYFVYKQMVQNAVQTSVRLLNTNDRVHAIAQMLSGEKPTAAAIENAKEMML